MTQQEILDYNKMCAEFLGRCGKVNKDLYWINIENMYWVELHEMKFHSDWNWIMEIKNKICSLTIVDEFNTQYNSVTKGCRCSIINAYTNTFLSYYSNVFTTEIEATTDVINQFLNWYKNYNKRN